MSRKAFIDFETRGVAKLPSTGAWKYARSAELMCLVWSLDNGETKLWTPKYDEGIDELFAAIRGGCELHAHNAAFEIAIWECLCVPKLGWPKVSSDQWYCSAAQAAAAGLPRSLAGAGSALGLPIQKDDEGHRIMMQLARPRKPSKHNSSIWVEIPEKLEKLYDYCRKDVVVERLIHQTADQLSDSERRVWLLDQKINDRGIPVDLQSIQSCLDLESRYRELLIGQLKTATEGEIQTPGQIDKIIKYVAARGVNISDLRSATVDKALEGEMDATCRTVLSTRQRLSKASTKKLQAMADRACPDGRIRGAHQYYGAGTGRWSGRGVQFQNLARDTVDPAMVATAIEVIAEGDVSWAETMFGDVQSFLSSMIRSMVCAQEGKRLIVVDFASIEARVNAWISGQEDVVDDFTKGVDAYKRMASNIYKCTMDEVTKDQRFVGKQAVLGLGYQMGAAKFQKQLEQYGMKFDDLVLDKTTNKYISEFCIDVVRIYRETNAEIRAFWYACKDAAINTVKKGKRHHAGRVSFSMRDGDLKCLLPCGRERSYVAAEVRKEEVTFNGDPQMTSRLSYMSVNSVTRKWERTDTFGGKIVENIVQSISRDFLVDAMFGLEAAGYPIVMHVHDEVVCEVDEDFGSLGHVEDIVCTVPVWGEGCPIDAEGFVSKRYRK